MPPEANRLLAVATTAAIVTLPETAMASPISPTADEREAVRIVERDYPVVPGQWSTERANAWYDALPWLVGCNYLPATAINQIEMWQASTFDPETIEQELGWAESIGMNTLRVYLHDLVWADDAQGLYERMDTFLDICQRHGIRPSFVFFDDCHYPEPKLGPQPLPVHSWHNSGWVTCPSRAVAWSYAAGKASDAEVAQLKGYVQGTIRHFKADGRVLYWEIYNEPGRGMSAGETANVTGNDTGFGDAAAKLVYQSWIWAREVNPSQPLTSNCYGSVGPINIEINRANSDILSIHCYGGPKDLSNYIAHYKQYGRPVIMTEWLARTNGSTVAACLPLMKEQRVGAINWGFVSGKSGTVWPWSSRTGPVAEQRAKGNVVRPGEPFPEPELWFHDLLRTDGTPFDPAEIELFRRLTAEVEESQVLAQ